MFCILFFVRCAKAAIVPAALLLSFSISAAAQKPHILMISIDGMKPEYVTQAKDHNLNLPVLTRFLSEGTYAEGVLGVTPTVTYPSHTTMVTGVWPIEHGILANTLFDPLVEHKGEWYWYFRELKSQTLYQAADAAGLKTAAVGWPVTVGAPIDYLIAEFGQSEKANVPQGDMVKPIDLKDTIGTHVAESAKGDEKKMAWSIGIINNYNLNFILVHLTDLDHQQHLHSPFSDEANRTIEVIDHQVGELIDAEMKQNLDAKIVIVSDHGFVRVDHKVALNAIFAKAGLIKLRPGKMNDGTSTVVSWDAEAWESGGTAAIMVRDHGDTQIMQKVAALMDEIARDPAYGVNKVISGSEVAKHGGNPDAVYLIDFEPGWAATGGWRGDPVKDAPSTGTHGYLPDHPELRSAFMVMGKGIAKGKDIGVIDMRQIAPSVAEMLSVKLPAARMKPVSYTP